MNNSRPDLIMLTDKEVNRKYYEWLYDLVAYDDRYNDYSYLLKTLYVRQFYWSVKNDDNRAFEGKELRIKFCEELDVVYDYTQYESGCSMLELIINLAYKCEYIMTDQGMGYVMRDWFWKILENVGLDNHDNDHYDDSEVVVIINKIIDRSYKKDGTGGLFPLKKSSKDQRKVELWYQMNSYLVENYF